MYLKVKDNNIQQLREPKRKHAMVYISWDRLGYAAITYNPQISITSSKGLLLSADCGLCSHIVVLYW